MTALQDYTDVLELDRTAQDLLFLQARTANTFTDEPVTDEQLRAVYELIKYAPTSMNQQPLRMVVIRSSEARAKLVELMSQGNKAKTAAAPAVVILAADVNFHEEFHKTFPHLPGAKGLFDADAIAREQSARFNAGLQVAYFILGVRAAGLAAGPMTGYHAAALEQEFFADGEHRVLSVINIGRPGSDAWLGRLPRLDYDDVATVV